MTNDFKQLSQTVMDYILSLGRGKETIRSYTLCFELLGKYLKENQFEYSPEIAAKWICSYRSRNGKTERSLFKAAINKMNDLWFYGEIRIGHYDSSKTIFGMLNSDFRAVLEHLTAAITEKSPDTVEGHRHGCAGILLRLQQKGISDVSSITYNDLLDEFFSFSEKSYYSRTAHHENLRLFLQFLYNQGKVPYGFTLFVTGMTMRKGYFWNQVSPIQIAGLNKITSRNALNLDGFLRLRDSLYQEHLDAGYSQTALTGLTRVTNLFFLFMDMNQLRYVPPVGHIWLDSFQGAISATEYKHFRRILGLLEQRYYGKAFPLDTYFVYKETLHSQLPDWCKRKVDKFLSLKKMEGWADSTISMYRSSICRFCIYLSSRGISSFEELTSAMVKQFNLDDKHRTPAGKNAYNSRIRKFLQYLGETGVLVNPFFFLTLPCVCAAKESLVITLTEEEQDSLRNLFRSENSKLSLRKKAMIQLGLYMGIRGADIVSIAIDDIDWENVSIKVVQKKTDYEIDLPMPTPVANALYKYIMYERPKTDTRNIFVRKNAPFSPIGRGACRAALKDALPTRDIPGSGFHVTRKTFATNLLRSDIPPQQVAEALGQQTLDTVHKYLSLDEERMCLCGLRLSEKNLTLKGGACHD